MTHSIVKTITCSNVFLANIFFASTFFAMVTIPVSTAIAQTPPGKEKCYGVAKSGEDDGSDSSGPVPGMSSSDYQGDAYKFVTEGTCKAIMTPFGPGDTAPIADRPPKN